MRPDEGQTDYEEVQKELSSKEEELEVSDFNFNSGLLHTHKEFIIYYVFYQLSLIS